MYVGIVGNLKENNNNNNHMVGQCLEAGFQERTRSEFYKALPMMYRQNKPYALSPIKECSQQE
jgi:hypothetical protein